MPQNAGLDRTLDSVPIPVNRPLWELGIAELAGHNWGSAGRANVNEMLQRGWIPLHIHMLKPRKWHLA